MPLILSTSFVPGFTEVMLIITCIDFLFYAQRLFPNVTELLIIFLAQIPYKLPSRSTKAA
jgi:hypothetical protein